MNILNEEIIVAGFLHLREMKDIGEGRRRNKCFIKDYKFEFGQIEFKVLVASSNLIYFSWHEYSLESS